MFFDFAEQSLKQITLGGVWCHYVGSQELYILFRNLCLMKRYDRHDNMVGFSDVENTVHLLSLGAKCLVYVVGTPYDACSRDLKNTATFKATFEMIILPQSLDSSRTYCCNATQKRSLMSRQVTIDQIPCFHGSWYVISANENGCFGFALPI